MSADEQEATPVRWKTTFAWIFLVLQISISLTVVGIRFPIYNNDRWIQDDAYISFRYAKNLVQGNGLVYNVGDRVEGYTNFLWTMISAAPIAAGQKDPIFFMHSVGMVLWWATYFALLFTGVVLFRRGLRVAPLALIPLCCHYSFNMWFYSGMETPLLCFFTVLTMFFFVLDPEKHRLSLLFTGLSGVGLLLSRPDTTFFLGPLALAVLFFHRRPIFVERKWRRYVLLPALPFVAIYLPYTVWRVVYYGSFYPNTYYAKVAYLSYYSRGWEYLTTYFKSYPILPWLPFLPAGAVLAPRGAIRRYLWAALLGVAGAFFYVVRLGGDFMEWRLVLPATGILYPAIVAGAFVTVERLTLFLVLLTRKLIRRTAFSSPVARWGGITGALGWGTAGVALLLLVRTTHNSTVPARSITFSGQETIPSLRKYCEPSSPFQWKAAGILFNEVLPPNAHIATPSAGIIPFFCERPCLDLHGLADREIAHGYVDPKKRGRVGHEHRLESYDTMRERGADVHLWWVDPQEAPVSLGRPPQENFETVSTRLPDGRYVMFDVLNPDHLNMEALRRDPRLVFYDPGRLRDPNELYLLRDKVSSYEIVDTLDLENENSERGHQFKETYLPETGHNYHVKTLVYTKPCSDVVLTDSGRRIFHMAEWIVENVSANRDMLVVIRYDHTGNASYEMEVNGRKVPGLWQFPRAPERWDEALLQVPQDFLRDGTNEFKIIRLPDTDTCMELYYLWFLQPKEQSK